VFLALAMSSSAPSVYFILGTPGSGRREIVADLIDNGLPPDDRVVVLLAESETTASGDDALARRANTEVRRWTWDGADLPDQTLPTGASVFFFSESRGDAITQLEALKPWLARHNAELARVFCVVDCQLAEKNAALSQWFDACIHFSDVVFLTNRQGVQNKWLSAFIRRYEDQFFPCHFIQVKKSGISNPALVLDPQPRRVAQYFDEQEELPPVEIETDDEEDEEEDEDAIKPEPYFERNRSGRRVKEVPDIRQFL
jgi:hypothetical protein